MIVILTSCGRYDLLDITISSFLTHADIVPTKFIVYDDYGWNNASESLKQQYTSLAEKYPNISFHAGDVRIGQINALDWLMQHVDAEYYMTLEDDWEFYKTGFMQKSIDILSQHPDIIQCWLREVNDTNGHPIIKMDGLYSFMSTKHQWKGFSFNPAVRRLADYKPYSSIAKFNPSDPASAEKKIGEYYFKKGFRACIINEGFVKHIGNNRTVK